MTFSYYNYTFLTTLCPHVNNFASENGYIVDHFIIQHIPMTVYNDVDEERLIQQLRKSPWITNDEFRMDTLIVLFVPLVDAVTVIRTLAKHPEFEILPQNARQPRRRFAIPQAEIGNKYLQALTDLASTENIFIMRQQFPPSNELNYKFKKKKQVK